MSTKCNGLYPNLDTLAEKGLVKKGEQERRTNYYALTDRDRREIEALIHPIFGNIFTFTAPPSSFYEKESNKSQDVSNGRLSRKDSPGS